MDYTLQGAARFEQEYNTNIQLLPDKQRLPNGEQRDIDNPTVWGSLLAFDGAFSAAAPEWRAWARGRFDNYFYTPLDSIDRQNQIIDAGYSYSTERSRLEIVGNYTDDALLASQTDLVDGILALGLTFRQIKSINPSWTYLLTEQTRWTLSYSFAESEYQTLRQGIFPDSSNHTASTSLIHQLDSQWSLSGNLAYTSFSTATQKIDVPRQVDPRSTPSSPLGTVLDPQGIGQLDADRTIEFYNFMLGAIYLHDPSLEFRASAGAQYSETRTSTTGDYRVIPCPITAANGRIGFNCLGIEESDLIFVNNRRSDNAFGPLFSVSARKTFEQSEVELTYSRQITPSINSQLLTADRLTLNAKHKFSDQFSGKFNFTFLDQSRPIQSGDAFNQTYFSIRGDLYYHWTPQWALGASYQYRLRDIPVEANPTFGGTQDSHAVFVNLRYDFEKLQF